MAVGLRRRGLPRAAGHRAGVLAARRVVERAPDLGIGCLTLYAFSSDNWRRPAAEVQSIFWLLRAFLRLERRTAAPARRAVAGDRQARSIAASRRSRRSRRPNGRQLRAGAFIYELPSTTLRARRSRRPRLARTRSS